MIRRYLTIIPLEALIWLAGLAYLAMLNPYADSHMSICAFRALGIDWCPGCGLGRSIAFLFHGDVSRSLDAHPLGIPALAILSVRIITLLIKTRKQSSLASAESGRGGMT